MFPAEADVKAQKGLLREQVREAVAALPDEVKEGESERICWILEGLLHPPREEVIGVFLPLKDEPDITPLIEAMLRAGQPLCAPRIEGGKLVMRRFSSLEELQQGPYGNLEPPTCRTERSRSAAPLRGAMLRGSPSVSLGVAPQHDMIATILVPGIAFDRQCNRLGRGLGFYDRFIAEQRKADPKTNVIGVCFGCQLVGEVPVAARDQAVENVVSPGETVRA